MGGETGDVYFVVEQGWIHKKWVHENGSSELNTMYLKKICYFLSKC